MPGVSAASCHRPLLRVIAWRHGVPRGQIDGDLAVVSAKNAHPDQLVARADDAAAVSADVAGDAIPAKRRAFPMPAVCLPDGPKDEPPLRAAHPLLEEHIKERCRDAHKALSSQIRAMSHACKDT
jgi:hypothetical protein